MPVTSTARTVSALDPEPQPDRLGLAAEDMLTDTFALPEWEAHELALSYGEIASEQDAERHEQDAREVIARHFKVNRGSW